MKSWKNLLLSPSQSILEAVKVLNDYCQFAVVVDEKNKLLGTVTDGDIRRGILRGLDLNKNLVLDVMNKNPVSFRNDMSVSQLHIEAQSIDVQITFIPLIDESQSVTDIFSLRGEVEDSNSRIPVVIMAGGLGSRLGEMTKSCPKPLLRINGVPILEIILTNLKKYKFQDFYISVNYKSEMIEDYFKDGKDFDVNIRYIREPKKLGTAGCLSLVDFKSENIVVINGDVLTKVNFQGLLDFHFDSKSAATMCVREYNYTIPYGVVKAQEGRIISIEEKPSSSVFVNAGVYVLKKTVLDIIPKDQYFDMPSLFKKVNEMTETSAMVYPIHEYWMDIGQKEDFMKAQEDYTSASDS